jgi:hypothetical protein
MQKKADAGAASETARPRARLKVIARILRMTAIPLGYAIAWKRKRKRHKVVVKDRQLVAE